MASEQRLYDYVAFDASGRRVRGSAPARTETHAFEQLKRQGFAPIEIRPARAGAKAAATRGRSLGDRQAAEFLADLAALLQAGSDMRAALSVIAAKSDRMAVRAVCRDIGADISGGTAVDEAFARALGRGQAFVPALVAAGEASGDLAGGFQRAGEMLASQVRLSDQLVSVLSYPLFVLFSSIAAMGVILVFVIPALAPLVEQPGVKAPLLLGAMMATSSFLRGNLAAIGLVLAGLAAAGVAAHRAGLLGRALDRLVLDGPVKRTSGALVYGAFAISLGNMLAAGAPMAGALRLAIRSIRSPLGRERMEPVAQAVRQGRALSDVLAAVPGFPLSVVRLAAIGEASGGLGAMMSRAGKLEEEAALRRIESIGRLIGPALIVILGGLIGLMMGGLLSGISQLGDAVLQ